MTNLSYQEIESQLPLREATFFILLSLAQGGRHGYSILKEVRRLSTDRVILSTGTLYGALKRMLEQGWIERIDEPDRQNEGDDRTGPPRKAYVLTAWGRQILDAEAERLKALLSVMRSQIPRSDP